MNCPVCQVQLTMTERQGVEIDYCPTCRGVWLDRGELDKLIERSAGWGPPASAPAPTYAPARDRDDDRARRGRSDDDHEHRYPRKKREGFLSDLFDLG